MTSSLQSSIPLRLARKPSQPLHAVCQHVQRRHESIVGALHDIPSSYNKRIRVGRGASSGYGKTSGRGHKGQKQHGKVPFGFQGGQTTAEEYAGKRGFVNVFSKHYATVPLTRIQSWIAQGRLSPDKPITPRELIISKCVGESKDGIKLLSTSRSHDRSLDAQPTLTTPLNIVVSRASASAIAAVEKAGGTVMTRYYTKWAMHQIVNGKMDPIRSMRSETEEIEDGAAEGKYLYRLPDATSRKAIEYYRDSNHRGYLAYTVGEHEGPSLFHKPPRRITKEEIEEKKRMRGITGEKTKKKTLNADANRIW